MPGSAIQPSAARGQRTTLLAACSSGDRFVACELHPRDALALKREFAGDRAVEVRQVDGYKALKALRPGGRVAYPNGVEPIPTPPSGVLARSYDGTPDAQAIEKLNRLIDNSDPVPFQVHVARSFPLDHAAEAQRALDEHYLGKLALQTG